jgi:hypothetical protein
MASITVTFGGAPLAESGYHLVRWQTDGATNPHISAEVPEAASGTYGVLQITGDLGGTAASPSVVKLRGTSVSGTAPTSGQVLKIVGGVWTASTLAESDITGLVSDLSTLASSISSLSSAAELLANKDDNDGYAGLDSSARLKITEFPAITGDVTTSAGSVTTTVAKLQGVTLNASGGNAPLDGQVLQYSASNTDWEPVTPFGGSGSGGGVRTTQTKTTASLALNATETGVIALNKTFTAVKVTLDRAARLQLYSTAAARTADASRPVSVPPIPGTNHGVIADWFLDGSSGAPLAYECSPAVEGANLDSSPVSNIYYRVTMLDSASAPHTVGFTVTYVGAES